jgi:hypothetical protein
MRQQQHIPSPNSGYFSATIAAAAKIHRVAIDRKRMILRSFAETSLTGVRSIKLPDQRYAGRVYEEEDRGIEGDRLWPRQ